MCWAGSAGTRTGGLTPPVSVDYVWDANYAGIDFPKQKTTVLRISGTNRSLYWRATTLDRFVEDHWLEKLEVRVSELATGELPVDPLLPVTAPDEDDLVTQEVEVVGLRDEPPGRGEHPGRHRAATRSGS